VLSWKGLWHKVHGLVLKALNVLECVLLDNFRGLSFSSNEIRSFSTFSASLCTPYSSKLVGLLFRVNEPCVTDHRTILRALTEWLPRDKQSHHNRYYKYTACRVLYSQTVVGVVRHVRQVCKPGEDPQVSHLGPTP
jgi:hypothetical protein